MKVGIPYQKVGEAAGQSLLESSVDDGTTAAASSSTLHFPNSCDLSCESSRCADLHAVSLLEGDLENSSIDVVYTRSNWVGSHPVVPLQLQRCSRACHRRAMPRTYDVIVEIGAAKHCETPRKAFKLSRASRDLIRAITPASEQSKATPRPKAPKHPINRRSRWQRKELPPMMRLHDALPAESCAKEQHQGNRASTTKVAAGFLSTGSSLMDPRRSSAMSSLRDRSGSILNPLNAVVKRASCLQTLSRPTSRASSRASDDSYRNSALQFGLESTLDSTITAPKSFAAYNVVGTAKSKNCVQMKKLAHYMSQSMFRSFPRDAWDACNIPYPDADEESYESESRKAELEKSVAKRKVYITVEDVTTDANIAQLIEERQIAELAKESGWSVLDVEEVRELFSQHSTDGRINFSSGHFEDLLLILFSDAPSQVDEIRSFMQNVIGAHRSQCRANGSLLSDYSKSKWHRNTNNPTSLLTQSSGSSFSSEAEDSTASVTFPEFYFALTRWLHRAGNKDRGGCCLRRFLGGPEHLSMDSDDELPEHPEDNDANAETTEPVDGNEGVYSQDSALVCQVLTSVLSD